MYVYIYICVYTYIHAYIHTYIHIHVRKTAYSVLSASVLPLFCLVLNAGKKI